jgi:hypothetical protein
VRHALAAALLLAGCGAPPPKMEIAAAPRGGITAAPRVEIAAPQWAEALRVAADHGVVGFARYCIGGTGRPALMTERLKADGFTATPEEATPEAPFRREVWRNAGRPFFVTVVEGGAGCTVVAPFADGDHAAALLSRAMQRVADEGGPVAPLLVPAQEAPGGGAREERYQIRPNNGPLVMEIRLRANPPGSNRVALILVATLTRDNATRT